VSVENKPNYRIYALVIGEIIPAGKFFDCEIKMMNFGEQQKRNFSPIQSAFSETDNAGSYSTYATSLPYIDPLRIKSEYVIICDIKESDVKAALGGAIRRIDKICRFLTVAYSEDFRTKFNRNRNFLAYLYQVNKIYFLKEDEQEQDIDFKLESGYTYLPNRPEFNEWRCPETAKFLEDIFYFHDEVLERSIKYLYRSSVGIFINDSPEKIALDHFKSIEIIINHLGDGVRGFKNRLDVVAKMIKLTKEEKEKVEKCWNDRSKYSDTAHPSLYDQAERYPNQFPIPSNVNYPHGFTDSIAADVCIKYFLYVKNLFNIDIEDPFSDEKECLGTVNAQWESNHLFFRTPEKDKKKMKKSILKHFISEFEVEEKDIIEISIIDKNKAILMTEYKV
jgi:hypothetical protein